MNNPHRIPHSANAARTPQADALRRRLLLIAATGVILLAAHRTPAAEAPLFVEVTRDAGFTYTHGVDLPANPDTPEQFYTMQYKVMAGGVAAGDYDRDGWVDLYVVRGSAGPNLLFRNLGNGRFEDVAADAGVAFVGDYTGPVFAD